MEIADHLKRLAWMFLTVTGMLAIVSFVARWSTGLGCIVFLFVAPFLVVFLAVFGVVHTVRGFGLALRAIRLRDRVSAAAAAPVAIAAILLAAPSAVTTGFYLGSLSRLLVNRSDYDAIIANAECVPSTGTGFQEFRGIQYSVDRGPPLRIAFAPEGILDSWSGIIFDPSGELSRARRRGGIPDEIRGIFGGDLIGCRPLWGDYYQCTFT